ncbi:aldo/keto reductase [Bradyrhizobium sp. Ec3.3]|uniref:aldo/keto reductase n=1 Tax=Bradyrhizobium sp. Ec3.3 TaxID=189753 RepID=UPI000A04D691
MRTIHNSILSQDVSALGFGCASLGSRIGTTEGLRSIGYAYDLGVNWYDVAPPYGDGQAEGILGSFLKGRRDQIVVCTKVGIARPEISRAKMLLRYPARWAIHAFPGLRKHISRARSVGSRPALLPTTIRSSVETSLRLLKTDYVDVLALHEPSTEDCTSPPVLEALADLQRQGLVRAISIAGSIDSILAGRSASNVFHGAQFPDDPFAQNLRSILRTDQASSKFFLVTHSVFAPSVLNRLSQLLNESGGETKIEGNPAELLLDYALANNPMGTVVLSMYSRRHITENCSRASQPIDPSIVQRINDLVASTLEKLSITH